ncbi:MAG TPA: hypothetical protein VFC63_21025 [Blastocatellia bacterium]|nr:hypothetical protein [Blastocatellia bacterium]
MAGKKTPDKKSGLSRREFARNAALLAVAAAAPIELSAKSFTSVQAQTPPAAPQLNAESEAQYQAIIQKYGSKLSDDQKADIKRILAAGQKSTETLRAFPLDNADEPANIFRVTEPKKRS